MIGVEQELGVCVADAVLTVMRTTVQPGFRVDELVSILGAELLAGD
jgi:hypothetical protein